MISTLIALSLILWGLILAALKFIFSILMRLALIVLGVSFLKNVLRRWNV